MTANTSLSSLFIALIVLVDVCKSKSKYNYHLTVDHEGVWVTADTYLLPYNNYLTIMIIVTNYRTITIVCII